VRFFRFFFRSVSANFPAKDPLRPDATTTSRIPKTFKLKAIVLLEPRLTLTRPILPPILQFGERATNTTTKPLVPPTEEPGTLLTRGALQHQIASLTSNFQWLLSQSSPSASMELIYGPFQPSPTIPVLVLLLLAYFVFATTFHRPIIPTGNTLTTQALPWSTPLGISTLPSSHPSMASPTETWLILSPRTLTSSGEPLRTALTRSGSSPDLPEFQQSPPFTISTFEAVEAMLFKPTPLWNMAFPQAI